jgi:SAM-dependent methyltransferase
LKDSRYAAAGVDIDAKAAALSRAKAARHARRLTAILLLVGAWYGALGGAESLRFPSKEAVETRRGTVFLDRWNASLYRLLSRELKPGEKVLVLPEINAVDVIFGVRSVSPLLFHFPGWLEPPFENELIRRFEAKPPDAVVLFNRPLHEFGVARFGEGYGELLSDWVSRNYQPVATLRSGSLLRRKTASAASPAIHPTKEYEVGTLRRGL